MRRRRMLFFTLVLTAIVSCTNKPIELDYCKMIADDQSYVNQDKTDMVKFNVDRAKRSELIRTNFNLLMQKTEQDGLPFVSMSNNADRSCRDRTVIMTMLHGAQVLPDLFFGKRYASLFKAEMDKGNLKQELLEMSSILTAKTIDLCEQLRPDIESALLLWGLDSSIFKEAAFVECD